MPYVIHLITSLTFSPKTLAGNKRRGKGCLKRGGDEYKENKSK